MITTRPPCDPPTASSPALHSLPRVPYVIPPELRRLRSAWSWARCENAAAAQIAARLGVLTEATPGPPRLGDVCPHHHRGRLLHRHQQR